MAQETKIEYTVLVLIYFVLTMVDFLSTFYALSLGATEGNPLLAIIIELPLLVLILKLLVVSLFIALYRMELMNRYTELMFICIIVLLAAVCVSNIAVALTLKELFI